MCQDADVRQNQQEGEVMRSVLYGLSDVLRIVKDNEYKVVVVANEGSTELKAFIQALQRKVESEDGVFLYHHPEDASRETELSCIAEACATLTDEAGYILDRTHLYSNLCQHQLRVTVLDHVFHDLTRGGVDDEKEILVYRTGQYMDSVINSSYFTNMAVIPIVPHFKELDVLQPGYSQIVLSLVSEGGEVYGVFSPIDESWIPMYD